MLKTLTKKLRRHSLNEIHPFQLKISYHGSGEGVESDDSEGENQELAQIDRERRRNCALTLCHQPAAQPGPSLQPGYGASASF
ncbi:unnamed protein product [Pleuronectes platessa]|uniref:Uncharacterized protein n=1 Tax=Pleuronectes platessa TaxID=8262 RepID=A0A9N7TW70_PLEPL|nr:unnamed protein product [Pleuronectes platessa]